MNPQYEDSTSSVAIVVYAENQTDIDAAIQNLENLLDRDFLKKVINDDIIREFTPSQVSIKLSTCHVGMMITII